MNVNSIQCESCFLKRRSSEVHHDLDTCCSFRSVGGSMSAKQPRGLLETQPAMFISSTAHKTGSRTAQDGSGALLAAGLQQGCAPGFWSCWRGQLQHVLRLPMTQTDQAASASHHLPSFGCLSTKIHHSRPAQGTWCQADMTCHGCRCSCTWLDIACLVHLASPPCQYIEWATNTVVQTSASGWPAIWTMTGQGASCPSPSQHTHHEVCAHMAGDRLGKLQRHQLEQESCRNITACGIKMLRVQRAAGRMTWKADRPQDAVRAVRWDKSVWNAEFKIPQKMPTSFHGFESWCAIEYLLLGWCHGMQ